MIKQTKQWIEDNPMTTGIITGLILPVIFMVVFLLSVQHRFDTFADALRHFQFYNILFKIVSFSILPGVGLFMIAIRRNWLLFSKGLLISTLLMGAVVLVLYLA